jgi:hypothetical protein
LTACGPTFNIMKAMVKLKACFPLGAPV